MGIDLERTTSEITAALREQGCYVTSIEAESRQNLVDIRWAARRAGDALDVQVTVQVDQAGWCNGRVPVTVRLVEPRPHDRPARG